MELKCTIGMKLENRSSSSVSYRSHEPSGLRIDSSIRWRHSIYRYGIIGASGYWSLNHPRYINEFTIITKPVLRWREAGYCAEETTG